MKKLFSLFAAVAVVFTLAACEPDTIIEEKIVYQDKIVYEDKIVKEIEVVYETITEYVTETVTEYVSADVENERFYKPGVYFNNTAVDANGVYTYTVVVVDDYGQIAGIMFDDTKTSSEFLTDGENLYVYIAGDGKSVPNTYRLIDVKTAPGSYPTAADAITADDLVVGIHQAAIAELEEMPAYESSRILGEAWVGKTEALVERIMADQTTYGIITSSAGDGVVAVNVDTDLDNVDVLMGLVQDILDGDAALTEEVELATDAVYGLYTPGAAFATTERVISHGSVSYYTSFAVVDEYGRIAGVYNDATAADKVVEDAVATKWIMKEAYGMGTTTGNMAWYLQAKGFGEAVVKNQGVAAIEANADFAADDTDKTGHEYTDLIAGTTIGVEGFIEATNGALGQLPMDTFSDGTYFVAGEGETKHAFMYVTVADGELESILLDNTQGAEQATVLVEGEWFNVFTFESYVDEENSNTILVYFDGVDYITMEGFTNDEADAFVIGDEVEFLLDEENGIDEFATLEIVPGNLTKHILAERYVMASGNQWDTQADALAAAFVANGVYGINFTEAGKTDVTGVTVGHIDEYQQMLVSALLQASADTPTYVYDPTNGNADTELVEGTYFAALDVNEDAEQAFAWMNVDANGAVTTLVFDKTTVVDGKVTTVNNLFDSEKTGDDDLTEGFTLAARTAATADYNGLIDSVVAAYSYGNDEFAPVSTSTDFEALVVALAKQAVEANVAKEAAAIFDAIDAYAKTPILTGENEDSSADLMAIVEAVLATENTVNVMFDITFTSSNEDVVGVSSRENSVNFEAETNTSADLTVTLELNDYVSAAHAFTLSFVTEATTAKNAMEADIKLPYGTIVEGSNLVLPTITYTELDGDVITATWVVKGDDTFTPVSTYTGKGIDDDKVSETVTFVAWFDTLATGTTGEPDTGEISREFSVVVMDEADAVAQVKASATPGNILEEVTAESVSGLTYDESIGGVTLAWSMTTTAHASLTSGVVDITRQQNTTEEATLVADITSVTMSDTKEFHFYVPQADTAVVAARIQGVLNSYVLDHAQFDKDTAQPVLVDAGNPTLYTNDTKYSFKWEVVEGDATFAVETDPTITFNDYGTVKVKLTVTADSADGVDSVKVSKEFTMNVVDAGLVG